MPTVLRSIRTITPDNGSCNALGERNYSVSYQVDQADGETVAEPMDLLLAAMALAGSPSTTAGNARIPEWGEQYSFNSFTDLDSYVQNISWQRKEFKETHRRWLYTLTYGPPRNTDPGVFSEPDPLLWPVLYDVDWIEEQVPLEEAAIVENLSHVGRAADSVGPVINSAGVEFTEGLLKTIYYPVLIALKNYETLDEIVALNLAFQGTTNDDTFFGAAARKAKYLMTASGGRHEVNGQVYYPGTTRIWFKDATWDRKVLNNGWEHFEKVGGSYVTETTGEPRLFPNAEPAVEAIDAGDLDAELPKDVLCGEPRNLKLDGTLLETDEPAIYLTYRDLGEVDYAGIGIGGT